MERYLEKPVNQPDKDINPENIRAVPVITARGCAFKCTFCHYVF